MGAISSVPLAAVVRDGFGIQVAAWAVAATLQTERFYDATGAATFWWLTIRSLLARKDKLLRNWVNSGLVLLWSGRLGSFLVRRILKDGKDRRFDKVRTKPAAFLVYWVMQGLWTVVTGLPVYLINAKRSEDPEGAREITALDLVGWTCWILGFALQVTADSQKHAFRADPANKDSFITTGVWAWSQHPNYFGEMAMWVGVWISSASQMQGLEYATVLCPLFNVCLLRFVSGVPLLQRHARQKWGDDPVWQRYHARTPLLLPNPTLSPVSKTA
ncbi:3-oxo-5-alpha-steroid 4-dehydrogenase 1 [Hondaea fermentalgiana]|uniref:3-oxo-5-alpha-steroid 4-dehydrogenase 1 n=1 Tax=Hondaea fermentalgiana TaxID=2315210 RepID=A0A2R5GYN3_9STRA|nr:3-oxo-5-alpha-steroid 4-dehydrogenase 1 [Hondaea fermentalgiana]|eukprot:GBG33571.1 3-oxo-5-alpha-steroid 4-dehydrogenase 1 [Hondaea fermentalgiana]